MPKIQVNFMTKISDLRYRVTETLNRALLQV